MGIKYVLGDITTFKGDIIVNAANRQMSPGGGVDGAINRAAGPELGLAMERHGWCDPGEVRITHAYNLPVRYIIHTVGPIYKDYKPMKAADILVSCYISCFHVMHAMGCKTIAFPLISTGVYGFPLENAARIAVRTARVHSYSRDKVTFYAFDKPALKVLKSV